MIFKLSKPKYIRYINAFILLKKIEINFDNWKTEKVLEPTETTKCSPLNLIRTRPQFKSGHRLLAATMILSFQIYLEE